MKTLAKMDTASSLVVEHHVSGGTLMMVADDLANLRRDAERWRKLRASGTGIHKQFGPYIVIRTEDARLGTQAFTEKLLDAAVDALPDPAT